MLLRRTGRVTVPAGELDYVEQGTGRPVVFVHGLLANADLWRQVLPRVAAAGFRCLAPDWPLGSHTRPLRQDADMSPPGVARLMAAFLAELDLRDVLVVANDTGGALTQILMAEHPDRLAGVVLTPSDAFERFLPPIFTPVLRLARVPGAVRLMAASLRWPPLRRLPVAYGWLSRRPLPEQVARSYLDPAWRDARIRRDLRRFMLGVHPRHTLAAARGLPAFDRPVLLAWAPEDRLFPMSLAHRLAGVLPRAELAEIPGSYTFVPEDQPAALAERIIAFGRRLAD